MHKIVAWSVWFGDEIASRVVYLAGFIVLVSGAMSWIASHITPIAQYGWGAVVFAGIGIACIITLVFSGAAVAWRYFDPLPKTLGDKRDDKKPRALAMSLNVFQFLTESWGDKGVYKLSLTLKATQTIGLTRVTVLFNRAGGNGSHQISAYDKAHQMLSGEVLDLVLMHYRSNVGAFWGDAHRITERKTVDHLNQDETDEYIKRYLSFTGYYFCRIVAQLVNGEEEHVHFTILIPPGDERPCVLTGGADHADYDPNRHIPALQGYA